MGRVAELRSLALRFQNFCVLTVKEPKLRSQFSYRLRTFLTRLLNDGIPTRQGIHLGFSRSGTSLTENEMKYDDASWHYGGDFPPDLPSKAGATHIAMLFTWTFFAGLLAATLIKDAEDHLKKLAVRSLSPTDIFLDGFGEKLHSAFFTEEGNDFLKCYYDMENFTSPDTYLRDYVLLCPKAAESLYHVPDTWETFDALAPTINARFLAWKAQRKVH